MQSIIQYSQPARPEYIFDFTQSQDADLLRRRRSLLRHNNRQDTVLQACADRILVNARGEAKGALEVTEGPLGCPEMRLVLLSRSGSSGVGGA